MKAFSDFTLIPNVQQMEGFLFYYVCFQPWSLRFSIYSRVFEIKGNCAGKDMNSKCTRWNIVCRMYLNVESCILDFYMCILCMSASCRST